MTERSSSSPMWLLCFLLHLIAVSRGGILRPIPGLPTVNFSQLGDLNVGLVLQLHKFSKNFCGKDAKGLASLQKLEAFAFAVDEINNRSDILPNVTLGFVGIDDCGHPKTARARALHFIQCKNCSTAPKVASVPPVFAVAVIGTENSERTMQMADIFSVFKVPMLSYQSSSRFLDDKVKFPYFFRTIPSDERQCEAIVDTLKSFGWSYVSFVYSAGIYGTNGFLGVRKRLEKIGYCLAATHRVLNQHEAKDYEATVLKLQEYPKARVVVLFLINYHAHRFFRAVKRMGMKQKFTWVSSDTADRDIYYGLEDVVSGMISFNFVSSPVDRFERSFKRLTLSTRSINPFFRETFSSIFKCSLSSGPNACDVNKQIMTSVEYRPEHQASALFDAVYTIAYALDDILKNCTLPDISQCVKPQLMYNALKKVDFAGEGSRIYFDELNNCPTSYQIRNYFLKDGTLVVNNVGCWDSEKRDFSFFQKSMIRWQLNGTNDSLNPADNRPPVSVCSEECGVGQRTVSTAVSCCFYCEDCLPNERTVASGKGIKCERCPRKNNFTWPDELTRRYCVPINPTYLHILRREGILLIVLDTVVFVMTCTTAFFYIRKGQNRLIKASSRELSIMVLAGDVLTCMEVFTLMVEPTNVTCVSIYAGFHLSFTLTYSIIFVKTNRIYRIFIAAKTTAKKPQFLGSKIQMVFASCFVAAQIVLLCITMGVDPPMARMTMPTFSEEIVYSECSTHRDNGFLICISFNLVLMGMCASNAFKTRTLPANFNETKYIMFSIYITILLWLSFLSTYFTAKNYILKSFWMGSALLFNVLSTLVFLFLPKLYAVYFLSHEELYGRSYFYRVPTVVGTLKIRSEQTGCTVSSDNKSMNEKILESQEASEVCPEVLTPSEGEAPTGPAEATLAPSEELSESLASPDVSLESKGPSDVRMESLGPSDVRQEALAPSDVRQEALAPCEGKAPADVAREALTPVDRESLASVGEPATGTLPLRKPNTRS